MNVSPAIEKFVSRTALQLSKHSPVILTTVGVAAILTSGVLAARNTLRLERTLDDGADRLYAAKKDVEDGEAAGAQVAKTYVRNSVEVAKLYLTPASLMVGGLVCVLSAQNILHKRNVALAAAYKGLESAYGAYRERVREELGEEKESDLYYNLREEEVVDEKGKATKVKRPVDGQHSASPYRFIYDMQNENWSGFHDDNLFRVTAIQNMFNDRLRARGHVLLHEVLDTLGFERTPASIIVGWIYDENNPDHVGDNFIEFNIRDYQSDPDLGYILLDFNVDGTIFDKI